MTLILFGNVSTARPSWRTFVDTATVSARQQKDAISARDVQFRLPDSGDGESAGSGSQAVELCDYGRLRADVAVAEPQMLQGLQDPSPPTLCP